MHRPSLGAHFAAMTAGGYDLNPTRFAKLSAWNRVLFQIHSASRAMSELLARQDKLGELDDLLAKLSLLYSFVIQYSKCFSSSGQGLVTLDEKKVFSGRKEQLSTHRRIINLRNNFVAHNGLSDLVLTNMAVKEEDGHFIVRHHITLVLPGDEYPKWKEALDVLDDHVVGRLNRHLDRLQEELGKPIVLDES